MTPTQPYLVGLGALMTLLLHTRGTPWKLEIVQRELVIILNHIVRIHIFQIFLVVVEDIVVALVLSLFLVAQYSSGTVEPV